MSTDISSYLSMATSTGSLATVVRTEWETKILKFAEGRMLAEKFMQPQEVQPGVAGTLRFNRYLRAAKQTDADTRGTLYGYEDAKKLYTNKLDVQPEDWGDSFVFERDVKFDAFISNEQNQKVIGNQLARSLEARVQAIIAAQCMRHRIDNDATYTKSGTCDAGSSATALVDNALSGTDWTGAYATIYDPESPGYDQTSKITAFNDGTDTATVAFDNALTTSSKYRLVLGTDISASDVLTTAGLMYVQALHRILETEPFDGELMRAFLTPQQEYDLRGDDDWKNSAIYDDSSRFHNYKLTRWLGTEFYIGSKGLLYREDVDGTANDDGVVHVAPIFGSMAYSIIRWGMGEGAFDVEFHYKDKADTSDLRNQFYAISWTARFAAAVLRATSIIGLMTGATDFKL